jgi:hypothetical protein
MSSTQHTNYLHLQPYPYPWLGWRVFAVEGPQTSRASHQQSPKEKTSKHFINALLLHEALKHDLHLSILSTRDCSDIACWRWFAGFGNLLVRCIKSIMPSLLTCDKIMYQNWHLRPSTVAIWSRILWIEKLAGHGPKPDPRSRRFKQIETRYIIHEEFQQRAQEWRSRKQGNEVEMEWQ